MHKTFSYRNLSELGINPLTGEACAFAQRILCDLNEQGVDLLSEYWGVKRKAFNENYNSKVEGMDAIASCMIDRRAFFQIITFAARRQGYPYIILDHINEQVTVTDEDGMLESFELLNSLRDVKEQFHIIRNVRSGVPSVGSRNVHQMSGRVV